MCSGPLLPKILTFALPLAASGVLQLLFNAADIVVVGRWAGDNSLAAVGSNTALINLLVNLFIGLSVGTNILAARFVGAQNREAVRSTV
ncbi:MAG: MATE family efflux transporter, partial [Oscillospiraceae bacterium]|nr:MATE family efflux transporter [Oscillospiraceae bacterium]